MGRRPPAERNPGSKILREYSRVRIMGCSTSTTQPSPPKTQTSGSNWLMITPTNKNYLTIKVIVDLLTRTQTSSLSSFPLAAHHMNRIRNRIYLGGRMPPKQRLKPRYNRHRWDWRLRIWLLQLRGGDVRGTIGDTRTITASSTQKFKISNFLCLNDLINEIKMNKISLRLK